MSITANMFRSRTIHAKSWILNIPRIYTHSPRKSISIGSLTRRYTQQPRQSAEAASFDDNGLVKHTGQDTATITMPKRAHCQLNDREVDAHYLQLRDACHCPQCVDPQTKQRSFRTSDIPSDIKPQRITWVREQSVEEDEQELLEIAWNKDVTGSENESHVTRLPADDIITPPAHYYRKSVGAGSKKIFWDAHEMKVSQPWINFQDWMNDETLFRDALNKLSLYGLIFLENIPDSREMVSEIAMRMGPLRNTFYGLTWDVRNDPKAQNVAYTNLNLGFHMDLLYVQNPPGFQLLHCLKNSCEGGESMFVDAFGAARDLDQETWEILSSHRVPYHYNHKEQYYRTTRPILELPDTKDESLPDRTLSHVNYSPPFQGPYHISQGESSLWPTKMKKYMAAVRKFEQRIEDPSRIFELKLKPGQCVIFENRRILHARRAFDTTMGERWLAGAYVDEDAVHSRMFTLKRNAGEFQTKS